jgi:hypothetical protein
MRNQRDRDTVTLEIFTTLLIFVLVAAVGTGPMIVLDQLMGDAAVPQAVETVVLACALGAAATYLWRHRRP